MATARTACATATGACVECVQATDCAGDSPAVLLGERLRELLRRQAGRGRDGRRLRRHALPEVQRRRRAPSTPIARAELLGRQVRLAGQRAVHAGRAVRQPASARTASAPRPDGPPPALSDGAVPQRRPRTGAPYPASPQARPAPPPSSILLNGTRAPAFPRALKGFAHASFPRPSLRRPRKRRARRGLWLVQHHHRRHRRLEHRREQDQLQHRQQEPRPRDRRQEHPPPAGPAASSTTGTGGSARHGRQRHTGTGGKRGQRDGRQQRWRRVHGLCRPGGPGVAREQHRQRRGVVHARRTLRPRAKTSTCIQGKDGSLKACADCFAAYGACGDQHCLTSASRALPAPGCLTCLADELRRPFMACSGISGMQPTDGGA